MAKEITLAELGTSTRPVSHSSTGGVTISPSDLAAQVRAEKGIVKDDSVETGPIFKDAMEAVDTTIKGRIDRFSNEYMPIIEENAREMAEAAANGVDITKVKLPDRTEEEYTDIVNNDFDDDEDDYSDFDDVEDTDNEYDWSEPEDDSTPKAEERFAGYIPTEPEDDAYEDEVEDESIGDTDNGLDSDLNDLDDLIDELEDDDEDEEDEETNEQLRKRFKKSFDSVNIVSNPIDLGTYTVQRNAVSSSKVLNTINKREQYKRADWALYYSGRSMTFEEGRGQELDALRKTIGNSNGINNIKTVLQYIYNHVIDANKPSFEQWCKLIRTEDIESLYFGHFIACYSDANVVVRECSKKNGGCDKTSLIETNIKDMVKFEDEEAEKRFYKIFNKDTTTESTAFESEMLQISDDFVISYTHPTLYSTFIQYSTLDPKITEKFSDVLDTMAYIDGFYAIDRESQKLVPLAIKEYPNNFSKTVMAKIKVYKAILKTLTNDQYNALNAKLNTMIQTPKISYIYPEATCPECGATIPEEPIDSVLGLLFTRAQLAQVKSL